MHITVVAGARPNFMKVAPLIHNIQRKQQEGFDIEYSLVHTGQHYDKALSQTFFDELNIPKPAVNLEVGSGTQAVQTATIMVKFEEFLLKNRTDLVLVVGDINSTMACSIVAKKMNLQLVHVEAGIRSFDLSMPEEINRMVTDAIADHFFTTSDVANANLLKSGVAPDRIHFVGNTMIDTLLAQRKNFRKPKFFENENIKHKEYIVLTLHRPSNVDDAKHLRYILQIIAENAKDITILFPVHPRTRATLENTDILPAHLKLIEPLGYLEFMYLVNGSLGVITDSGGVQEETTVLGIPCLTLRKNSERPETITVGTNVLVEHIADLSAFMNVLFSGSWKKGAIPALWDGNASARIIDKLLQIYS